MSGQSIVDRLNAAKHTVAGSALGRAVVKATTEEMIAPKRKHLDYLLQCTSEINVSIPQMADLLIERTQNTSWVVTYKALITIHHLMCYGNERFSQYMASHSSKFYLNNFIDRNGTQGIDMSSYIRKYAHYLNEKRETYKLMGFDFCKVKRGKDDGMLRTMNTEKLLKTLPILQKQLDVLLQFDVQPNELTNGVINSCFVLLSKDLIRLFACYNDGIINLLEKFFDMNKKNCKEALDIYKKFLDRTDGVSAFLKVAESSGMDKSDIPDLTKAPGSLLEALESHVNGVEGKKPGTAAQNGAPNKPSSSVTTAINSLNSNTDLSADERRRVIEEEAKTLEALKANHLKKTASSPTHPEIRNSSSNDLFDLDVAQTNQHHAVNAAPVNKQTNSASDDLLMLSGPNPFIQNLVNQSIPQQTQFNPYQTPAPLPMMSNMMPAGGFFPPTNAFPVANPNQPTEDLFGDIDFSSLANEQVPPPGTSPTPSSSNQAAVTKEFDAFGDVLQPTSSNSVSASNNSNTTANSKTAASEKVDAKILSNDLDSSLASLANNLDINHKNNSFQKNHQWNSGSTQQGQLKTGGQQWKPAQATTPMGTGQPFGAPAWNAPAMTPMGQNPMMNNPFGNPFQAASSTMPGAMQTPFVMSNQMQQQPVNSSAVNASNNPFDLF